MPPKRENDALQEVMRQISEQLEKNQKFFSGELTSQTAELRGEMRRLSKEVEDLVDTMRGRGKEPGLKDDVRATITLMHTIELRLAKLENDRGCYYAATAKGKWSLIAAVVTGFLTALAAIIVALVK